MIYNKITCIALFHLELKYTPSILLDNSSGLIFLVPVLFIIEQMLLFSFEKMCDIMQQKAN